MNKRLWNFSHNTNIFIQENASEYVVCKMVAILFRPQYVKQFKYNSIKLPLAQFNILKEVHQQNKNHEKSI